MTIKTIEVVYSVFFELNDDCYKHMFIKLNDSFEETVESAIKEAKIYLSYNGSNVFWNNISKLIVAIDKYEEENYDN